MQDSTYIVWCYCRSKVLGKNSFPDHSVFLKTTDPSDRFAADELIDKKYIEEDAV